MSKAKDFYSKSVTEAIRQACADFATSQEKLDIEVVETGSKGIFGLCKKRAHIRVNLKEQASETKPVESKKKKRPQRSSLEKVEKITTKKEEVAAGNGIPETGRGESVPEKEVPSGQEESTGEEFVLPSEEVLGSMQTDLSEIVRLMGFESEVTVTVANQTVQCHIKGEHEESLVGQEGRTLDSLQYLMRKIASRRLPEKMMIDLDAGNFRERRMKELQELALELAEQVKDNGKTKAIPALNPSERRVVHVALQDDKGIRSRSVGDGIFKKVLIYKPGKGRKSGGRRRGRQGGGASAK